MYICSTSVKYQYMCIYIYIYSINRQFSMYIYIYIYTYIYIYIYICICSTIVNYQYMYIHIYIYIYTIVEFLDPLTPWDLPWTPLEGIVSIITVGCYCYQYIQVIIIIAIIVIPVRPPLDPTLEAARLAWSCVIIRLNHGVLLLQITIKMCPAEFAYSFWSHAWLPKILP